MEKYMIRLATDAPGVAPQLRDPVPGRWYVGIEIIAYGVSERAGELMCYDGGAFFDETDDFCDDEPRQVYPEDYDYLQEQR